MSLDMLCVAGTNGYFKYLNPSFTSVLGWSEDELLSTPFLDFVHPDDIEATIAEVGKLAHGALTIGFENRYRKKDGDWCWMHWTCQPDTTTGELFAVAHDITAFREATQELSNSREQYKEFFDFSHAMICSHDMDGVIQSINPQGAGWLGYDVDFMVGKKISEFIVPDLADGFERYLSEIKEKKESQGILALQTKDGKNTYWTYSNSLREADGEKKVLAYALDISNRINLERELKTAKEIAERSVAAKDIFLANVSHEIRTPMNAIVGFADLLHSTQLNAEQKEFVDAIASASSNLLVLINDILDLSKIESGKLILDNSPFSVSKALLNLKTLLGQRAKEKGLGFDITIDDHMPERILGDVARFNQILINLIGNAIKFTEVGHVKVTAKMVSFDNRQRTLAIDVEDTGPGIPTELKESLFERFEQGDINNIESGGTGLGLNIARHLAKLMEGEITFRSELDKGSTFTLLLPVTPVENDTISTSKQSLDQNVGVNKYHILVAEDNALNQKLLGKVLDGFGWSHVLVEDGQLALEALKKEDFDLIIMDLQMPNMTGYEAAKIIRKEYGEATPILAMTAHSLVGEREKCLALGMNDYMAKPFRKEELKSTAHYLIKNSKAPSSGSAPSSPSLFNLSTLKELANGDQEFVDEIVVLFRNTVPREVSVIGQAIHDDNRRQIKISCHRVKSSLKTIGASETAQIAEVLESKADASSMEEMKQLHLKMKSNLQHILKELP